MRSIDSFPARGQGNPQGRDERLSPDTIRMIEQYNSAVGSYNSYSNQSAPLSGNKVILVGDQQVSACVCEIEVEIRVHLLLAE